ncbi:MAG: FAD-dependent oxidoreductase [Bacteroidota bacterium]|nr:FAD-dependent oxidoreductase [Bacteroidota bacterium]
MYKIENHPIIEIKHNERVNFIFNGKEISGEKDFTIAAALHQAGYPVHSHSLSGRKRSLECGIGKCGACEMLVDGHVKRICITKCNGVKEVREIEKDFVPDVISYENNRNNKVYKTKVLIIGAGPAGLAVREKLDYFNVDNIVIDSNEKLGGQFLMQTHQFFFFEKERRFAGMRGFEIAKMLAGQNTAGIMLDCTAWDILDGNRTAVKNFRTGEIFFIDSDYFVVATGAVPFLPSFHNDDLPGVYTAAVIQKMMNIEQTLMGKNVLTIGSGNIGYLTSYQLIQAGANIKAIIEALPKEGGFPVQANRIKRLGIPVILSHQIIEAIPNENYDGIQGAVIAQSIDFKPVPGTEKVIRGIDTINICTGLMPDDALLIKGYNMFGRRCFGAGDATRIGEGTSAVLRGTQVAYEILMDLNLKVNYEEYLSISKEFPDSQQHPVKVADKPLNPTKERMAKPFVQIDCLYGFACNPCVFACTHDAISKHSTDTIPTIDFDKCIGCMDCVYQCPGLAIFGYNIPKKMLYLPFENFTEKGVKVFLVDNNGKKLGNGIIHNILKKKNLTNIAMVKAGNMSENDMLAVRGFILEENYPELLKFEGYKEEVSEDVFLCHCEDVKLDRIIDLIGDRKYITVDEIKHNTHLGMGPCRGKRCLQRLRNQLKIIGIDVVGGSTPRAPLSNQILIGELYPQQNMEEEIIANINKKEIKKIEVSSLIAGGGMGGSSLFRYLAEAGLSPVLINDGVGSSWRNIGAGRPAFSLPELSDIAMHNLEIFTELSEKFDIDFYPTHYINFAHDEKSYQDLEKSMAWQKAEMIDSKSFNKYISPYFNKNNTKYIAALRTYNCWQATPGKVINALRNIGISFGGKYYDDTAIVDLKKINGKYIVLVRTNKDEYIEYHTNVFINALGANGNSFAKKLGINTGLYPVKHQAFITRRMPNLGIEGKPLDMLIDRRVYKGFLAVYGQQIAYTGQIIGCASPAMETLEAAKDLKTNSKEFLEIVSETFTDWIPQISSVGIQATWSGYYTEPKMVIDPELGLFLGLRGQGFMLSQYLAKLFIDKLTGKSVPEYFERLKLGSDALDEKAFK